MSKVLIFSDIHNDLAALKKLMEIEADAYFAAGDLVSWARGLNKMGEAMMTYRGQDPGKVYVLPGNHESAADIETFCAQFGFVNFHGATAKIGGVRYAGMGYSTPTPFDTPGECSEEEMAARLATLASWKPEVLVCHAPPLNTGLDRIRGELHAGSRAVAEFIEEHQPKYFFCGHVHEAEGLTVQIGRTRAINVGKRGYLLEL